MEWVETTGRTIEDALDAALDELGVDENDVEYEVIARAPRRHSRPVWRRGAHPGPGEADLSGEAR